MKWISEKDIVMFLQQRDLDVRKSHNARWIDQKCAADVVTIVADCILNYTEHIEEHKFTSMDIWHNDYTIQNVESFFKKPNLNEKNARNEYDKFFQQPMEMLAYAGVLIKYKVGNRNFYSIANIDVLNFLALREKNTLIFIQNYIEKVLRDSNLFLVFQNFFENPNAKTYIDTKTSFSEFTISHTSINGTTECNRIFIKILNPIAYKRNTQGTERGRLSKYKVTYDMLMYNRNNFIDVYANKPKDMTRNEFAKQVGTSIRASYSAYLSQKAKRLLRIFNDSYRNSRTEVVDERHMTDVATHMHHIFPEAMYPEICMYLENIIALTPTQHINYAHPNGNTMIIDEGYQHISLIAKSVSIRENLENSKTDKIYDFNNFMFVLFIGFEREIFKEINTMDFDRVIKEINLCYV